MTNLCVSLNVYFTKCAVSHTPRFDSLHTFALFGRKEKLKGSNLWTPILRCPCTFREYSNERTITFKPVFLFIQGNARAWCKGLCLRVGTALRQTKKKSLPGICNGLAVVFGVRQNMCGCLWHTTNISQKFAEEWKKFL